MTDAELLALARRVWGEHVGAVGVHDSRAGVLSGDHWLLVVVDHPCPREALHAALRALVGMSEG